MNPSSRRRVVDLPAPFGPRNPNTSPCSTSSVRWSSATSDPNRFVRSSVRIAGSLTRPRLGRYVGAMADAKTLPTRASVPKYLAAIPDESRRRDARAICSMMAEVTGEKPVLWGESMIGFGMFHFKYASGRQGDWPLIAFAARKDRLTVYLMDGFEHRAVLAAPARQALEGEVVLAHQAPRRRRHDRAPRARRSLVHADATAAVVRSCSVHQPWSDAAAER